MSRQVIGYFAGNKCGLLYFRKQTLFVAQFRMKLRLVALRPSLLRPFSATTKNASSSVAAIDWQRVLDNTASPARSFVLDARSRHEDVLRLLADLRKSQVVIDFEKYRQRGVEEEVLREVEGEISAWKEPPLSTDKDHKAKLETLQVEREQAVRLFVTIFSRCGMQKSMQRTWKLPSRNAGQGCRHWSRQSRSISSLYLCTVILTVAGRLTMCTG